ncbi:ApaLI family restriction endonuclease [uncultured Microscilla sp.]|uniref:ApaLI family restriction endonuclease n=1 Tax=uncultured Microscilla sp. TaxID=432653 RepID=UPI0026365C32|nr:ApaLI family restriction endonuclease [uncultured Microscilla sp.]
MMFKVEQANKAELISYCEEIGIPTSGKSKEDLRSAINKYLDAEILAAVESETAEGLLTDKIEVLVEDYRSNLQSKIKHRKQEMKSDDHSHYLIYRVLGISEDDGEKIDVYQNTGRFLYKYAGALLEEVTTLCLKFKSIKGGKVLVKNTRGEKPRNFEIDFLDGNYAFEIKWRDATTDGDHITKEHTRIQVIHEQGYTPVRIMFYYPQRIQAQNIQATLKTLYKGIGGEYYAGDDAWEFIRQYTGYNLKSILTKIADKQMP